MATSYFRTAVLLTAGISLSATPLFAQREDQRNGGEGGRRQTAEHAQSRGAAESRARHGGSEVRGDRGRDASPGRSESRGRVEAPSRAESRARIESRARDESRGRAEVQRRFELQRHDGARERVQSDRRFDNRFNRNRAFESRAFENRAYGYGRDAHRSYAVPYGYRPYGYRPGWNLNLYFGRPGSIGGYPDGYGYFAIAPGLAYGAVRIVDAPRDAQVFVDGYYAGVVDDYDGVFQHLNLEAGPHHLEIETEGYQPFAFDVQVDPGRTTTYHARIF